MRTRYTDSGRTYDPLVKDARWLVPTDVYLSTGGVDQTFHWEANTHEPHWWRSGGVTAFPFHTEKLGPDERSRLAPFSLEWSGPKTSRGTEERESVRAEHDKSSTRRILDAFQRLGAEEIKPERYLRFARDYGPLNLCATHGSPFTVCGARNIQSFQAGGDVLPCRLLNPEPLGLWHAYARHMRGALLLSAALQETFDGSKRKERERELDQLAVEMVGFSVEDLRRRFQVTQIPHAFLLQVVANRWASMLRPEVAQTPNSSGAVRFSYAFYAYGLLGCLAKHLVFSIVGGAGLATCFECGSPYEPSRKPRDDQRNFCDSCRDGKVPQMWAARDARERKRRSAGGASRRGERPPKD